MDIHTIVLLILILCAAASIGIFAFAIQSRQVKKIRLENERLRRGSRLCERISRSIKR